MEAQSEDSFKLESSTDFERLRDWIDQPYSVQVSNSLVHKLRLDEHFEKEISQE